MTEAELINYVWAGIKEQSPCLCASEYPCLKHHPEAAETYLAALAAPASIVCKSDNYRDLKNFFQLTLRLLYRLSDGDKVRHRYKIPTPVVCLIAQDGSTKFRLHTTRFYRELSEALKMAHDKDYV